jgi:hypothetical protein
MPNNHSRILLLAATWAVAALPATASAKATPHVKAGPLPKLQAVSPLATAMPGARVPVRATLKGRSARTRLAYLLSADRRPSASDRRLGTVTIAVLRAGKTRTVTRTVRIPARGRIGSWYLLACLGGGHEAAVLSGTASGPGHAHPAQRLGLHRRRARRQPARHRV